MQIYWNKRKRLHKKRVQLPQDWFGTPTLPPFHYLGHEYGWHDVMWKHSMVAQLIAHKAVIVSFSMFWNFDLECKHGRHKTAFRAEKLKGLSRNGLVKILLILCYFACRWWYGLALGSQPLWSVGIRECWHFIKAESFVFISRAKVINSVDTIFRLSGVKIHTTTAENPRLF